MYENYKVFGPYVRKDNRKIVILQSLEDSKLKTVSYPKFLMEQHLGRYLTKDETVDHINADFTDDRIENLQILSRAKNAAKSFKDGTAHTGLMNLTDKERERRSKTIRGELNPSSKFNEKIVLDLRIKFKNKEISVKDIMKQYQVNERTTRLMLKGKTYAHVPGAVLGRSKNESCGFESHLAHQFLRRGNDYGL